MGVLDTARAKGVHRPHLRNNDKINKAASVVGHGKKTGDFNAEQARQHRSAPLATLKDPAGFGAPPRHRSAQENATEAPSPTTGPLALPSTAKPAPAPKPVPTTYASRGLGAALPKTAVQAYSAEEKEQEAAKNAPPPVPYRTNTTGLNTDGLPTPVRRAPTYSTEGPVRSIYSQPAPAQAPAPPPAARPKPQPPPRLPERQNSHPNENTPEAPPPYATPAETEQTQHQPAAPKSMGQLSELQSRFAKLPGRVSSPPVPSDPSAQSNGQGTTWQQKQAAMQTAGQFQRDPSSVSASDAYSAAKTAQDFNQRHGEQVASGYQKAKALDTKYGVRGRVAGIAQAQTQTQEPQLVESAVNRPEPAAAAPAAKKAPPPPPPPKRRELQQETAANSAPPPVPLGSKPK